MKSINKWIVKHLKLTYSLSFITPIVLVIIGIVVIGISGVVLIKSIRSSTTPTKVVSVNLSPTSTQITTEEKAKTVNVSLSGTYRCWSFNVSGVGGGSCIRPPQPPMVLNSDGTYKFSSEQGTYNVKDGLIYLSQSKIRGAGKLLEDNNQIRFEYDYKERHYTVTYLKNKQ